MKNVFKAFIAGAVGIFSITAASSAFASYKPDFCDNDHDHRSHHSNYYDHYEHDRYYRAGPYRSSGVSFSITFGDGYDSDRQYYSDRQRYGERRYDRRSNRYAKRHGYRGRDGRILNRKVFDTRHRARIVLVEEVVRTRRGPRLVCTVEARGREANYVSKRRMHRIANNHCSPRARIKVYA